jgi:lipopolysaccharide export LptBFGC system permease protein LptF
LWWKVLEFLAKVVLGVLLVYLTLAGFVALSRTPQFQCALVVFGILIGLFWWIWSDLLPEWFRKLIQRSLRRKEQRHER